jgi:hypothetical protein
VASSPQLIAPPPARGRPLCQGEADPSDPNAPRQRHLLRLWLAAPPPLAVPLPSSYGHLWKKFASDDRGLVQGADGRWAFPPGGRVPLEAEVGQAHIPTTKLSAR